MWMRVGSWLQVTGMILARKSRASRRSWERSVMCKKGKARRIGRISLLDMTIMLKDCEKLLMERERKYDEQTRQTLWLAVLSLAADMADKESFTFCSLKKPT